uniref:Short-chain dehydrogenase n=1 Tax=Megaselia scalaris TaxID=36166 RepID=T1GMV6_MEGSC
LVLYKQPGRIAVITGGNRGIGLRIIEKLLGCEMTVIMGCRDPKSAEKSVRQVVDLDNSKGKLVIEQLDVGNLASVRAFGKKIQENYEKLDILINN